MKKILLIGKTGQLGSALIKYATTSGFNVCAPTSTELNLEQPVSIEDKILKYKPDILINAAAYNLVAKCEEEPECAMKINFEAVALLAKICKEEQIKFVTFSTDYVFDGEKGAPYLEEDKTNPLQVYGISKLAGERAALNLYSDGVYIVRTSGLYGGKTGSPQKGNFIINLLKEAAGKDEIEISSEQISNPTYADDLARAIFMFLAVGASPGIYHLTSEGHCSWFDFAREAFALVGINKKLIPVDRKGVSGSMRRPKFSALANTKAKEFGIALPSWQDGLMRYIKEII